MYVTKLGLKSFKSYLDEELEFKKVTLLTGLNGAGKSTVFQALRMFWQELKVGNSVLSKYGEIDTLKNKNTKDDIFILTLDIENKEAYKIITNGNVGDLSIFQERVKSINFSYISANRLGPTEYQSIRNDNATINQNVGENGEYTLDILAKYELAVLPDEFKDDVAPKTNNLITHVNKWLQEISPNVKLETELNKKMNVASFTINGFTPLNVGFGVSYTLSVIVQLLYSVILLKEHGMKTVLLIENPEAHLHPRGQTKIAEFISKIANHGVQVIVETHSDYILDGLRLAVKDEKINYKDTKLYYFELNDEGNTEVKSPQIDKKGLLDEWPENFFDTSFNNKMKLI